MKKQETLGDMLELLLGLIFVATAYFLIVIY
jgi:hypothetical protein